MDNATKTAIERWLIKAANDLRTAQTMLAVDPPVTDVVCFHAQQCVEKCLKAFLTAAHRHVEKTHNLPRLVELCREENSAIGQLASVGVELTDYAVVGRYPDDWREIPVAEAGAAVQMAAAALELVKDEIAKWSAPVA